MTEYKYVQYDNDPILVDRAYTAGQADTAAEATHATSADTATSATSAVTAQTADALATARNLNVADADNTHQGTAAAFDGTAPATIRLPATIKADIVGNASTATDLADGSVLSVAKGGTGNSTVDGAPTSGSTKMVTSGGVYTAIANAVSQAFRYKGSVTNAQLAALTGQVTGDVYNISDTGTYPAGANVAWDGSAWDMLSPMYAIDAAPTQGSTNLVQSGGTYSAVQTARQETADLESGLTGGTVVPAHASRADTLGTSDVGSTSVPIYLDDGAPTACTAVAQATVPYSGITSNPWTVTDVTI